MTDDEARMLYGIYAQRAKQQPERSHALPQHAYRNPERSIRFEREKGDRMQRDIDEVEALLDLWADWMRRPEPITEGYPVKASGGFVPSWCKDTEEAAESADSETISKVNACYDSLTPRYRDAIFRHYGLGSQVWRFDKAVNFEDAKIVIRVKFVTKGLI